MQVKMRFPRGMSMGKSEEAHGLLSEYCTLIVPYKKLHPDAVAPKQGTAGSAGFDLTCTSIEFLHTPTCWLAKCGTGLAFEIPSGYVGRIYARSSIYKTGWEKVGGVCVIDSDYRGEVFVLFKTRPEAMGYQVGDRMAQMIIEPIPLVAFEEAEELSETARGTGGYGSTGR